MHQTHFIPKKKITVIQAVAVPVVPPPADSAEYRKQRAENYGFRQIGEALPENVTLKNVIDSLPKKVTSIFLSVSCFHVISTKLNFYN